MNQFPQYRGLLLLAAAAFTGSLWAQQPQRLPQTLGECIEYAQAHHLNIRKAENNVRSHQEQARQSRMAYLPQASATVGQSWSWGRAVSPVDNTYTNTHSANTGMSVGMSLPLFTGLEIFHKQKMEKENLAASLQDLEQARQDLSVQVATAFMQAVFNRELCGVAKQQMHLAKQQYERMHLLMSAGKHAAPEVAQAKAKMVQDSVTLVQAEGNYRLALVELGRLLEIDNPEDLQLQQEDAAEEVLLPSSAQEVYAACKSQRPALEAAKHRLQAAVYSIKMARAGYMPRLSLSLGLGSSYYNMSNLPTERFANQLRNNFNQYIGLNLNIPLFDRFDTRSRVRLAKLESQRLQMDMEAAERDLYKEVQTAWTNAQTAQSKYAAAKTAEESAKVALTLMSEKFSAGKASFIEFDEAKVTYAKAASEVLQAKYDLLLRSKILQHYSGIPIR